MKSRIRRSDRHFYCSFWKEGFCSAKNVFILSRTDAEAHCARCRDFVPLGRK